MNVLEKNLLGVPLKQIHSLLAGFLVAAVLAAFSIWASKFIGVNVMGFKKSPISAVMVGILIGMLIRNLITLPARLKPGLAFSVKKILRLGIILLGIRLSIFNVIKLGTLGVPIVLVCIIGAIICSTLFNKWLHLPQRLGTLIGVGTSICGVSAIVATGPVIDAEDEEIAYAVAVITIFGVASMFIYPYLAHVLFAGDPTKVGFFLGTAVHDTSQVNAGGMIYADVFALPKALDVAIVTKLVRNVFMVAVIPLMAVYYHTKAMSTTESTGKKIQLIKLFPLFVLAFLVMAMLRSIGDAGIKGDGSAFGLWDAAAWKGIYSFIKTWSGHFMVVALSAVGLSTDFRILKGLGMKPFLVGLVTALVVGIISFSIITLWGAYFI